MYCTNCNAWNEFDWMEFSDTDYSGNDNSSFDEDDMLNDWNQDIYQENEDLTSSGKRKRDEFRVPDDRPLKRVCRFSDISRDDAPEPMIIDDDLTLAQQAELWYQPS